VLKVLVDREEGDGKKGWKRKKHLENIMISNKKNKNKNKNYYLIKTNPQLFCRMKWTKLIINLVQNGSKVNVNTVDRSKMKNLQTN